MIIGRIVYERQPMEICRRIGWLKNWVGREWGNIYECEGIGRVQVSVVGIGERENGIRGVMLYQYPRINMYEGGGGGVVG